MARPAALVLHFLYPSLTRILCAGLLFAPSIRHLLSCPRLFYSFWVAVVALVLRPFLLRLFYPYVRRRGCSLLVDVYLGLPSLGT